MDRALKLAFVIPYFYPAFQYGGQPRAAFDLARGLARRGHSVRVLTTDSGGKSRLTLPPSKEVEGVEICYYRNLSNWLAYHQRLCLPLGLRGDISRQLKDRDIVHIHDLHSTLTVIGSRAATVGGKPYVLSGHGGLKALGRVPRKAVFDALWGKRILKEAAAVVAVSPIEEQDARDVGVDASRIHTIPNPIDTHDYKNLPPPRPRARRQILFLGRLHHIKGADILIEAFALAVQRASLDADLMIAGPDDGEESALRILARNHGIESRVAFTGYLEHQSKLQAFVDSSVTVIPSRAEVFALTAIESLLCGTPVILSSACGLHPKPDVGVTMFETGNASALAELLIPERPRAAAEAFISTHFSLDGVARQMEWLYETINHGLNGLNGFTRI